MSLHSEIYYDEFEEGNPIKVAPENNKATTPISKSQRKEEKMRVFGEWWLNKLAFIIEILDTNIALNIYKNGGISTEKPLTIQTIMMTSTMDIARAVTQRNKNIHKFNYSHISLDSLIERILELQFLSPSILSLNQMYHPLIQFLNENDCFDIAIFL